MSSEDKAPAEFSVGETSGSSDLIRRRHASSVPRGSEGEIVREPSSKEARTLYELRHERDTASASISKKAKTEHEKFVLNEKLASLPKDGFLDVLLDKVLRMNPRNLLRILYLVIFAMMLSAMSTTYKIMTSVPCHSGFLSPEDSNAWKTMPNIVRFDPYAASKEKSEECLTVYLENTAVGMQSDMKHFHNDNVEITNVVLTSPVNLNVYKLKHSIVSNITYQSALSAKTFDFEEGVIHGWKAEEEGGLGKMVVLKSILMKLSFLKPQSVESGTIAGSLIGLAKFSDIVVVNKMKLIDNVLREMMFSGRVSLSKLTLVKNFIKTARLTMEARVEDVMSITTTFKDLVIGGALSITKAQMSKTTVEDMVVKGIVSLKGVHCDRGLFTDFFITHDLVAEKLSLGRSILKKISIGGGASVEIFKLSDTSILDSELHGSSMLHKVRFNGAQLEGIKIFSTMVINTFQATTSLLTEISFLKDLALTTGVFKKSEVKNSYVLGSANLFAAKFVNSSLEDVYFGGDLLLSKSAFVKSSITSVVIAGDTSFKESTWKKVTLTNVTFLGKVDFSDSTFKNFTCKMCTFKRLVDFSRTKTKAFYLDAVFEDEIILEETNLQLPEQGAKADVPRSVLALMKRSKTIPSLKEVPDELPFPDETEEDDDDEEEDVEATELIEQDDYYDDLYRELFDEL
ncbi:hypothetical protein NDN08_001605 [Rhodosorus marinus]|uniref:Auto-transporter adhesin head GIN domain-containing protein n=1 Tax=Rhodosorus marinus TaxID=101924 RepID=A0AAV8USQ8_9RHOD|nr:hypothetical protein NDN08_001605 [Rhodosorus marinus]